MASLWKHLKLYMFLHCTLAASGEFVELTNFKGLVEEFRSDIGARTILKVQTQPTDTRSFHIDDAALAASFSIRSITRLGSSISVQQAVPHVQPQPIDGFNSIASSREHIGSMSGTSESLWKGISFVVPKEGAPNFMCGLASGAGSRHSDLANSLDFSKIDFAARFLNSSRTLHVWELGTQAGDFGSLGPGDVVQVALDLDSKVQYSVNGQVRYTSRVVPMFPLFAKISAANHGPVLEDLQWVSESGSSFGSKHDALRECAHDKVTLKTWVWKHEHQIEKLEGKIKLLEAENAEMTSQLKGCVQSSTRKGEL
jgi:hypothetical protein